MTRCVVCAIPIATLLFTGNVYAQMAQDLIGSWTLISNVADRDGKPIDNFGPVTKGLAIYHSNGHYSIIVMRAMDQIPACWRCRRRCGGIAS